MTLKEKEAAVGYISKARQAIYAIVAGCSDDYLERVPYMPSREEWSKIAANLTGAQAVILNEGSAEDKLGLLQAINHLLYVKRESYMRNMTSKSHCIFDTIYTMDKLIDAADMDEKEKEEISNLSHTIKQQVSEMLTFSGPQLKQNDEEVMEMILTLFVKKGEDNGNDGHNDGSSESSGSGDYSKSAPPSDAGVPKQDK